MISRSGALISVLLAATTVLLAGCETAPGTARAGGSAESPPGWISLERTQGSRSLFTVTLFEDGKVIFEGWSGDQRKTLSKTIPESAAAQVFTKIEMVDFWRRDPRYDVERINQGGDSKIVRTASTEAAWDILRAQRRSRMKRIDGLFFAPDELIELRTLLEQTVGLAEFLGAQK